MRGCCRNGNRGRRRRCLGDLRPTVPLPNLLQLPQRSELNPVAWVDLHAGPRAIEAIFNPGDRATYGHRAASLIDEGYARRRGRRGHRLRGGSCCRALLQSVSPTTHDFHSLFGNWTGVGGTSCPAARSGKARSSRIDAPERAGQSSSRSGHPAPAMKAIGSATQRLRQ
jgi:hypothetical protein